MNERAVLGTQGVAIYEESGYELPRDDTGGLVVYGTAEQVGVQVEIEYKTKSHPDWDVFYAQVIEHTGRYGTKYVAVFYDLQPDNYKLTCWDSRTHTDVTRWITVPAGRVVEAVLR